MPMEISAWFSKPSVIRRRCLPAAALAMAVLSCAAAGAAQGSPRTAAVAPASAAAKEHFAEARKLLRQGFLESARAAVQDGLKLAPKSVEGYNLLGLICGQQKDHANAIAAFQQALKLDPRSTEAHNNLGNSYVTQQKFDLAEKEFRATLRLEPRNGDANYNLGLMLLTEGHPDQAIPCFRRIAPPAPRASLNLVRAYLRAGQKPQALELARAFSTQAKNDVRLHFSLGVLLASESQYEPAAREFELADALAPGTFEILHNLGQAHLRSKHYDKAEEALRRALEAKPDAAETLCLLAQVYADQRKDLPALELLVRARKLAPQNTDVIFLMARLSMMQSFHEDAIPLLEEGVKIAPRRPDLHAALGDCYFTAGKVDKAIQEFQTLIQLDPSARSYAFMGLCYRYLGRYDEARKYLEEGLKIDPRNASCLYNLGYIEHNQGNNPAAEKFLQQALQVNPGYDDALLEMATVRMAEKRFEEALPLLRRCAKITNKPAQVYYKLATAERALHQTEAAARDLKIFQTLSKDSSSGPYPFQHFFESLGQRTELPARAKAQIDLQELLHEVSRHPDRPRNLYMLTETYLKLGQTEEAQKTVTQLDKLSGGDFRTALGVGVLLARYHLYPAAIQHFQTALAADPASDDAKYDLADAHFRMRDYPRALETLQQVSPEAQSDDTYLALLGDTYAHLGRVPEAIKIFQDAIERNPENDQYYLSLALTQLRAGASSAAEQTLRKGLARVPNSGRILWGLGILSALQGNNSRAEEYLGRSVDLMPEWRSSYSALGIFYYQTGQTAKAREMLDRFVAQNPQGGLNIKKIEQALANAPAADSQSTRPRSLSPVERQQFLEVAFALVDQNP
jgi:tetratricopeptide (TPR) repeat protein